jgi:hypothetical protein
MIKIIDTNNETTSRLDQLRSEGVGPYPPRA